jgi:hypothetical protein
VGVVMSSHLGPLARHLLPLGVHAAHSAPRAASHHSYLSVSAVRSTGRHFTPHGPCQNTEPPRRVSLGESDKHRCAIFFSRRHKTSPGASPSPPNTTAAAPSLFCRARLSSTALAAIPPTGRSYSPHRAGELRHHTSTCRTSESKLPAVTVNHRCRVSTPAAPPSHCLLPSTPSVPHPRCSSVAPQRSHSLFLRHRAPPPPKPADQELEAMWYTGARASPSSRAIIYSELTPTSSSVGRAVPDLCHRAIGCYSSAVPVRPPSFLSFSALMLHSATLGHGDGQCSVKKCPVKKRTSCLCCLYLSILHL